MRITAAILVILHVGAVHAGEFNSARMLGTWNIQDGRSAQAIAKSPARVGGPIVISKRRISWTSAEMHRCSVGYHIVSRAAASTFPGGPIETSNAADAYTIYKLELEPQGCDRNIAFFTMSLGADEADLAHFATFNRERAAQGYGAMHRISLKQTFP
ncbi:MAG TPA: hypothetical protein VGI32_17800 [Steroidobacteraceae bacterium]|jgi:hypothetical protein